jgi:hypothetical protein
MRGCTYPSICRSPDLTVVAMASETLQTKSKERRGEFVFGASMSASAIYHKPRIAPDYMCAHYQPPVTTQISAFDHHPRPVRMGGRLPSSARRMVDDSEGKAIGGGDCHMLPAWEGPVSGPIHRLEFFDPVLCGIPPILQAIIA